MQHFGGHASWRPARRAIFRYPLRADPLPPASQCSVCILGAQPLSRKNPMGFLLHPAQETQLPFRAAPSSIMVKTLLSWPPSVPLRKSSGVDNVEVISLGFRKHDNEFLAAPNYVLLKIMLKRCLRFLSRY